VSRTPRVDWGRDPGADIVTLGQHARHERYLITSESDGTVILTPAVVVSELEARLLRRPDVVEKLRADLAEPETRMKRRRKV